MPIKRVDALILGAGAAGLAAARDLSQAGRRITVVEAQPRIAGRILTLHDPRSPMPIELGAEFIHGEAPETLAVAHAARLMVVELPNRHEIVASGRFMPMRDFWGTIEEMSRELAIRVERRGKDFPVSEYLEQAKLPAMRRKLLDSFVKGWHAAHPERLSARALAAEADGGDDADEREGKQFRIANGNDALMQWLRDGLDPERTEVRLSTTAVELEWKRGGVTLYCRGGDGGELEPLRARTAVVTLPAAVLKAGSLRFTPAIPAKQRALAGLEVGQIFKIVLRFRAAFWDEAEFLKERRGNGKGDSASESINFLHAQDTEIPTWWTAAPARAPLITGWVGGPTAEALLSEEPPVRLERSLVSLSDTLAIPRRHLEEQLDAWASHDWRADPFARQAYSYIGVGGYGAPNALARPVDGTLFFAGDATNRERLGTVAGAIASGRRAAREVQRALG